MNNIQIISNFNMVQVFDIFRLCLSSWRILKYCFRTVIESAYKSEFAEIENILRSELAEALAEPILDVTGTANENIM